MNFDSFTIRKIKIPLKEPFEISSGTVENRNLVILEAQKDGKRFCGEASPQFAPFYSHETTENTYRNIERFIVPEVARSETIEDYRDAVKKYKGNEMAKAAGEFLLHHRKSFMENRSLSDLVDGSKQSIECGASIGIQETPGNLVQEAEDRVNQGFQRIKVKIKPGKDLEYIKALRKEFTGLVISADANAAYSIEDFDRLEKLDRFDIKMIEQPLHHRDLINHSKLADKLETPICLDESIRNAEEARKAVEIGACEIINLKPQRVGGLKESREIAKICEKQGLDLWVGSVVESGIGMSYALAAASMPQVNMVSDLAPTQRYFEQGILQDEITMEDGSIDVPCGSGLYSEVDRAKLEKFTEKKTCLEASKIQ